MKNSHNAPASALSICLLFHAANTPIDEDDADEEYSIQFCIAYRRQHTNIDEEGLRRMLHTDSFALQSPPSSSMPHSVCSVVTIEFHFHSSVCERATPACVPPFKLREYNMIEAPTSNDNDNGIA